MQAMRVNDISVYYEVLGEGEPLVLISGLGAGMSLFGETIRQLSRRFQGPDV